MAIVNITFEVADSSLAAMLLGLPNRPKVTLSEGRVRAMKEAGVWKNRQKRGKIIAAYAKADAPWGYKKDGTPKKRPGRAPKVAA